MKKLTALLVAPLAGVALLAGCTPNGSTAAMVNEVAIPNSRVTSYADSCATLVQGDGTPEEIAADIRSEMLTWAILGEMSSQHADSFGGPTEDEMRAYVEDSWANRLLSAPECAEAVLGLARHDLIALGLGSDIGSYFSAFDIEVNPRYGQWDLSRLEASGSGSLSEPAGL
ncbi:MAG: hypothetical protein ACOX61_08010 [Brooklawnia sp.]|jgi:hypothetical protein